MFADCIFHKGETREEIDVQGEWNFSNAEKTILQKC